MKKHIPNIITLLNLFCGCIAVIFAIQNKMDWAIFWVSLGIFFDFFDGFFARLLNVKSELGLQLDSLADMVTSGVTPGIAMFQMLSSSNFIVHNDSLLSTLLPYFGFLITLSSAYRLANFNIDPRQTLGFVGLPTPANALFVISLSVIASHQMIAPYLLPVMQNTWFLIGITLLSAYMLNAEIALFALKFKDYSFQNNKLKYIFLLISVLCLILLKLVAVPIIITLYVLLSAFAKK